MKTKYLERRLIADIHEEKHFELEYLLVEEWKDENAAKPYYGIEIVKKEKDFAEVEFSGGITYSRESALNLLVKLSNNVVTPITMLEVIDEYYELY